MASNATRLDPSIVNLYQWYKQVWDKESTKKLIPNHKLIEFNSLAQNTLRELKALDESIDNKRLSYQIQQTKLASHTEKLVSTTTDELAILQKKMDKSDDACLFPYFEALTDLIYQIQLVHINQRSPENTFSQFKENVPRYISAERAANELHLYLEQSLTAELKKKPLPKRSPGIKGAVIYFFKRLIASMQGVYSKRREFVDLLTIRKEFIKKAKSIVNAKYAYSVDNTTLLDKVVRAKARLPKKSRAHAILSNFLKNAQNDVSNIKKQVELAYPPVQMEQQAKMSDQITKLRSLSSASSSEVISLKNKLRESESKLSSFKTENSSLQLDLKKTRQALEQTQEDLTREKADSEKLADDHQQQVGVLNSNVEKLAQQVSELISTRVELQMSLVSTQRAVIAKDSELDKLREKNLDLTKKLDTEKNGQILIRKHRASSEVNAKNTRITELNGQVLKYVTQIETITAEMGKAKGTEADLRDKLAEAEATRDIFMLHYEQRGKENAELKKTNNKTESALKTSKSKVENLEASILTLTADRNKYLAKLTDLAEEHHENVDDIVPQTTWQAFKGAAVSYSKQSQKIKEANARLDSENTVHKRNIEELKTVITTSTINIQGLQEQLETAQETIKRLESKVKEQGVYAQTGPSHDNLAETADAEETFALTLDDDSDDDSDELMVGVSSSPNTLFAQPRNTNKDKVNLPEEEKVKSQASLQS